MRDKDIESNSSLLLGKSRYYISSENNLEKSESYFLSSLECQGIIENFGSVVFINRCLGLKFNDELSLILEDNKSKVYKKYYSLYKYELEVDAGDYQRALEFLDKSYSTGLSVDTYYTNISYLFVLSKEYQKLIDFSDSHRDKLNALENKSFGVNLQYSLKAEKSSKYSELYLRNILANSKDSDLRLAAFSVLGQENDTKRTLTEQIDISFSNFYRYKSWPIIPKEMLDQFSTENAA